MLYETSHRPAADAYPCESAHMICISENCSFLYDCTVAKRETCDKTRRKCGGTVVTIFVRYTCFVTFKKEVWCVQLPGAFLHKSLLAKFCFQYTSHEFFYRPCNFHFNILCSFEIIAKTLPVALEVSLSIFRRQEIEKLSLFSHLFKTFIFTPR